MLRNTSDVDVSDPQFKFKDFELRMSAQPQVLLEPAQICFLNGELFNESEAFYETSLDSLNQFRLTGSSATSRTSMAATSRCASPAHLIRLAAGTPP